MLGLWFTCNLIDMADINFSDKMRDAQNLMNIWMKRSITPLGRVAILKSLILSKLIYLWLLLPNPPEKLQQALQNMCFNFVWNNKRDKIKRTVSVRNVNKGGIGIPSVKALILSLKISWMKKLYEDKKWYTILLAECPDIEKHKSFGPQYLCNLNSNPFWRDVFIAYSHFYDKVQLSKSQELLAEPLFWNSKFKINKQTFCHKHWANKNIFFVKDLLSNTGNFLSYPDFKDIYAINVNFLEYYGCLQSIKKYLRESKILIANNQCDPFTAAASKLKSSPKGSKTFYNVIINNSETPNPCKTWESLTDVEIDWKKCFIK